MPRGNRFVTCRPEKQSFDPCVCQQRCRSVIRLSIQPPRVHLAVGVPHTHTHTHTNTLSSPKPRKGCLRKRGTRSRRCVHNNTQRHNNTDAESHSPNLIHRTEIRMSRARFAEGVPAGCATLRHNRTHAPTRPRKARTYMRI